MIYKRHIFTALKPEIQEKEITVLTGMRRVGKTTVMRHMFDLIDSDNKVMFDFENPLQRKIFEEENYDAIWKNLEPFGITNTKKAYIFIDEVQNLPDISRSVKYLYDHWDVKFFLTGSSSYYLRNIFPESLAGRKIVFELFPLTFREFLTFKGIPVGEFESFDDAAQKKNRIMHEKLRPLYDEYMEFGGFPSVVLESDHERKRTLLSEIFTSYFEIDAKNLADFRDMSKLRDLLLLLTARVGAKVEIAKLAVSLGVTRDTVYSYLSFLEKTYFIRLVPRFSRSPDRVTSGGKKVYFCDSGIAQTLGQLSDGQIFEQSVFQNLRNNFSITYFSKDRGVEIDFIADGSYALEVKLTASQRDEKTVHQRASGLGIESSYVVTHEFKDSPHIILATDL